MKTKRIFYSLALAAAVSLSLTSCNDYLDTMPDNRTQLDTEDKISDLLTTAYPSASYALVNELSSDNVDYYGSRNPNGDFFGDDTYFWKDEKESNNESMQTLWESCYGGIAKANQALEALEDSKNKGRFNAETVKEIRAEALLLRAYNHFLLVNQFCQAYNSQTSNTDPGIPVSTKVQKIVAELPRGTVADVYKQIDADIQEALPLVTNNYEVPKYHFNQKAAYAFATRFYLFYEQWNKAIEYADDCLGSNPATMMRDWKAMGDLPSNTTTRTNHYVDKDLNANLLLSTFYSKLGLYFGAYSSYGRYSHGKYLADNEDFNAGNIWGNSDLYYRPWTGSGTNFDKSFIQKVPPMFEYDDPVSGTGYFRTVLPIFNAEEVLLNRAEAYALTKRYTEAAADLTTWMQGFVNTTQTLTPASIQAFYSGKDYAYSDPGKMQSGIKKHLNPKFAIDAEGSVQESILQCVLGFRRIVTLHEGMRWWDIKRYGIEIPRREMGSDGKPLKVTDWLKKDDKRRALQIPLNVRNAKMEANPRD